MQRSRQVLSLRSLGSYAYLEKQSHSQTSQSPQSEKSTEKTVALQQSPYHTPQESPSVVSKPATDLAQAPSNKEATNNGLSKDDVKSLFFGAPQFMLEKGKHGSVFPQAFFPWNNDLEISDLQDRRFLRHESFALATLHAHLPIPDGLNWTPSSTGPQKRGETWKRPMFDLGIFEKPNMLSIDGKIPGTVGLRYFLELPLADSLRTTSRAHAEEQATSPKSPAHLSAHEAFKSLDHGQDMAKIGKHAPFQNRVQLIQEGPSGWKHVGVRNIDTMAIVRRFSTIGSWHDEVLSENWQVSILDKQDCATLHKELFEQLLYPPEIPEDKQDPLDLKIQIEALVKVLTTPGAWIDFSLVEWRIRIGQVLWELPPHQGSDDDPNNYPPGGERKWLLIQLLLAVELVIRLDGILRLGFAQKTERFHLSGDEIHHFNKLRNTKVNWDLVVARRFLDMLEVKKSSIPFGLQEDTRLSTPSSPTHVLSSFGHKYEHHGAQPDTTSTWDCVILPRQAKLQADGLIRFARLIEWPSLENFEARLTAKLSDSKLTLEQLYATPIPSATESLERNAFHAGSLSTNDSGANGMERPRVILQPADADQVGGWLSRSWLTGLAIPSEATSGLLMCSLLENDIEAVTKLGKYAFLHGGFVLDNRSWWSKSCIIGRVFASLEEGSECMGWISTPKVIPMDEAGKHMPNGWLDILVQPVPHPREGWRITDGVKLAEESSPLGIGHGKVMSDEFSMISDQILDRTTHTTVAFSYLVVQKEDSKSTGSGMHAALATFDIQRSDATVRKRTLRLLHEVYFISAYACRLPHGHAVLAADASGQHPRHKNSEYLPAHPLHESYQYSLKGILDLEDTSPPSPSLHGSDVWVLDARGQYAEDVYARAWCAQVGINALIAMSGKTCLSCAIREARALEVGLIIRIGSHSSS